MLVVRRNENNFGSMRPSTSIDDYRTPRAHALVKLASIAANSHAANRFSGSCAQRYHHHGRYPRRSRFRRGRLGLAHDRRRWRPGHLGPRYQRRCVTPCHAPFRCAAQHPYRSPLPRPRGPAYQPRLPRPVRGPRRCLLGRRLHRPR